MKILVTRAKGFVGKNLISELRNQKINEIFEYDIDTSEQLLDVYAKECDFVFHLAGVNHPQNKSEFMKGNFGFTSILSDKLKENGVDQTIIVG